MMEAMLGLISLFVLATAPDLSKEHRRFLDEEAVYIMTDSEREGFLALATTAERDEFIERFWPERGRTPPQPAVTARARSRVPRAMENMLTHAVEV